MPMPNSTPISKAKALIGIAVVAPLMFLFGPSELSAMLVQQKAERGAKDGIAAMRSEQRWLVGQGLAQMRPIGSFNTSVWNKDFYDPIGTNAGMATLIGGHELSGLARTFAPLAHFATTQRAISVDGDHREIFAGDAMGIDAARKATYRHEEAHARMFDNPSPSGPFPGLSPDASRIAASAIDSVYSGQMSISREWRSAWIATVRSEAFADAYSCLSAARRGQAAMSECALATHAARLFPSHKGSYFSTLDAAGNSHGVDMASFLAGQLDASMVAKLDAKGLDQLSARIADASVSWAVARQPGSLGFFSEQGGAWWASEAAKAGIDPARASLAWATWRESSVSDAPQSVFGDHAWTISGLEFKAKGLPEALSASRWRLDGEGGMSLSKTALDQGKSPGPAPSDRSLAGQAIAQEARSAALLAHRALSERMGVDFSSESQRLALHASGPSLPPLRQDLGDKLSERRNANSQQPKASLPKAPGL